MALNPLPDASNSPTVADHAFLLGGGITGGVIRSKDWSKSPVGPISTWPRHLKTLLGTILRARHPMLLWWGPDLTQFYNDAFVPSLGVGKHPAALGQPGRESWAEVWPIVGAQIEAVMSRGESIWSEDALVPIERNGHIEEVHWTYGYSPVVDDAGEIAGTLIVCNETTPRVLAERRLKVVRMLVEKTADCLDLHSVLRGAYEVVGTAPYEIPFAVTYRVDEATGEARREAATNLENALTDSMDRLVREHTARCPRKEPKVLPLPASPGFPGGPWPESSSQAFFLPLKGHGALTLVLGVSPRLPFDAPYRAFMLHFAEQLDLAIARVRAIQSQGGMENERRNLLLQAPTPTALMTGPEHLFELANPLYEQMVGRKVVGKTYLEAFPELEGTALPEILDGVYRTGKPFVAPESLVRLDRDGDGTLEDGFFRFNLEPLRDGDGEVYGMMAVAFDITEQVNARHALEVAEARAATAARQLDTILRGVSEGITAQGPDGRLVYANDMAARLSGFASAEEMFSTPPAAIMRRFELLDDEGKTFGPERLPGRAALQGQTPEEVVVCFRELATGNRRWSIVASSPVLNANKEVEMVINVFRDVTAAKQTEQNLRFLTEASALLGSSLDYEETLRSLTKLAVPKMADWCSIHLAPLSPERELSFLVAHIDPAKVEWARKLNAKYPPNMEAARGIPQVLRTGKPEFYPEVAPEFLDAYARDPEHLRLLRLIRMDSLMMVPLAVRGTVIGVITFIAAESGRRYTEADLAVGVSLAERAAYAVENARLYAAQKTAREQLELIARAGEAFSGASDYEETLRNVVQIALPVLGDFAFFDVVEGREVRRVAAAHEDPEVDGLIKGTTWARSERTDKNLCALSSGAVGFHPLIDDAWRQDVAGSAGHLDLLRRLCLGSMVTVPLRARGQVLGSLTLCFGKSGRHHTIENRDLAEELARRAGIAVFQARLHEEAQVAARIAEEAATRAEEASRIKDEFLATVSHELRTPLNAIVGWSSLLRERSADSYVAKGIAVIHRNAQAQAKIIDDILDVSRIITGKLRLELKPADLAVVIHDAIEVVRPSAVGKGITIEFAPPAEACLLGADPERLQQVVWNLLSNAVKFTDGGGRVSIVIRREGSKFAILVSDTGRGIDQDFLPLVFDRFKQADGSTTRRVGGLGLGLAIVRHIVELHGGQVQAESEGVGQGSTFTIWLPIRAIVPTTQETERPSSRNLDEFLPRRATPSLHDLRILVVDDEPDARDLLHAVLASAGAMVETAASAVEGIERVQRFRPHVIVSDIGMPDEDGYEFMRRLRALNPALGGGVPSIALTAYTRGEDRTKALAVGFTTHIGKPVNPDDLLAAVENLARFSPRPTVSQN